MISTFEYDRKNYIVKNDKHILLKVEHLHNIWVRVSAL